jgi:hypothetical protein
MPSKFNPLETRQIFLKICFNIPSVCTQVPQMISSFCLLTKILYEFLIVVCMLHVVRVTFFHFMALTVFS